MTYSPSSDAELVQALERLAGVTPREYVSAYPSYPSYGFELELAGDTDSVKIAPTDGSHVHVGTKSGERTTFESRGRAYSIHFSQHAYKHPDGAWRLEHPDPEQNNSHNGAGRLYGADELPPTAREKLRAEILEAVQAWTSSHAAELEHADRAAMNNAAQRREETARKLAGELLEQLEELRRIDNNDDDAPRY